MFATQATVHSTARATPTQLVFGRDAMLNIHQEADWKYINERKDKLITLNNKNENDKRRSHTYNVGDSVLVRMPTNIKFGTDAYNGPYRVAKVRNNGTLKIVMGPVTDTINIRNIKPYFDQSTQSMGQYAVW